MCCGVLLPRFIEQPQHFGSHGRGRSQCLYLELHAGEFLREAQSGACGLFGTVLGPEYNAAHANHFHFGMRGMSFCR
ncbi:extensin family protein [Halomonas sp. IOP_31]|uniref:extensin family protein n=1 Tax=Halomonas sp. IOP_31 TaxID=2876584 RepID=UPI003FA59FF4